MYLISVYFDENANKKLQKYINLVAKKTNNTFMTANNVPPHMTIASIEARNAEVLVPAFNEIIKKVQAGKIKFVSMGQLLPYVLYVTPVLNKYLTEVQNTVYEAIKDIPETSVSKLYRPYSWLPHVTIGKTLEREEMLSAIEIMRDNFVPFEATVTAIGLAKVNPHEDVKHFIMKQ